MRPSAILLALLAGLTTPGAAQDHPQAREGFWISFGFGAGSLGCDCNNDDNDRLSGVNFQLRMGGTLSQRLLIGGEVNGFSKNEDNTTFSVTNVGPVVLFYPGASGGFFLKGGLGLATTRLEIGAFDVEDSGAGLTLGLGYDARVGRGFALTPYFDILTSSYDGGSFNQVAFGLGFTWP